MTQLTRKEVEAALGRLPPEQHKIFLAEVDRRLNPPRVQAPTQGASLTDVMGWRQQSMGDLGRPEPQSPAETQAAGAGAAIGLGVAGTAATAPMSIPALGASAGGLAASVLVGNYVEKKLGLPWWAGEAFALVVQKKPRSKAAKLFRDWLGRAEKGAATAGAENVKKTIAREVARDVAEGGSSVSPTMGTTSRTAAPAGGLPANATLTRIPMAPKRPGIPRMSGGSKAQRAWMESQGLVPGSMGPDDVLAMKARGATQEEIEAALLRAARPPKSKPFGTPTPKVGEKPPGWKPAGPTARPAAKPTGGPTIEGGSAGESTLSEIVTSIKAWRGVQKLSKPQIESALREVYGIPRKEARQLVLLVTGG